MIKGTKFFLILVLFIAAFFRFYGLNWDQGQHLHPDERFLTMVLTSIKIPKNLSDYLNPKVSSMNPYNVGYSFFVYGTFPLYLTKLVGVLSGNNDYGTIHFVGRILSAFFDLGVVLLLFKIGQKSFNEKIGLLAGFFYSIMVLPIQLSHFFAVDTFLNFFIFLSFCFLILLLTNRSSLFTAIALGTSFGLALACKISAFLFLPIICLGFLIFLLKTKKIKFLTLCFSFFVFCSYVSFRFFQPQAFATGNWLDFTINPQFLKNLAELKAFNSPETQSPPAIQWKSTKPLIFPLKNMVLWGVGLPLGIISILSVFSKISTLLVCYLNRNKKSYNSLSVIKNFIILSWVIFLFTYQGIQFAKTNRYFLPIYPFFALLSAQFLTGVLTLFKKRIKKSYIIIFNFLFFVLILIYPLSFMNIYTKPITRVRASQWIYDNVPPGSTILNEEWDDGLPLPLPGKNASIYNWEAIFMYDEDSPQKWQRILPKINEADYIFISSNRAYGSIMSLPKRYPQTIKYYQSLFSGEGEFVKVAEFTSYPCFPPGKFNLFCFNDDKAEESFTVYDHPKVMIFKRKF